MFLNTRLNSKKERDIVFYNFFQSKWQARTKYLKKKSKEYYSKSLEDLVGELGVEYQVFSFLSREENDKIVANYKDLGNRFTCFYKPVNIIKEWLFNYVVLLKTLKKYQTTQI